MTGYHTVRKRNRLLYPVVVRENPGRRAAEWGISNYVTWKNRLKK